MATKTRNSLAVRSRRSAVNSEGHDLLCLDPEALPDSASDEFLSLAASLVGGEPHVGHYTGTKALMLAVLEDGIRSYLGSGASRSEAEQWVHTNKRRSPFSFCVVCETLGFEPSAVRTALAQLRARKDPHRAIGRIRVKVRRPYVATA